MRVFLTGATGSIGSSVLQTLLSHGHEVTCTVRSEEKRQIIASKGERARSIFFDINSNTAHQLAEVAVGYDALIHCAWLPFTEEGAMAENMTIDAMIQAARKTAETKPVSIVYTSGISISSNTNGIIDEDHDDPTHCWELSVPREKKIIDASSENIYAAVIRVSWVYGNSTVDQWIRACKANNKVVVGGSQDNYHISLIHHEDLANMYRTLVEKRGYGLFFAAEPEAATLSSLIGRMREVGGIQEVERVNNPWEHCSGPYGYFLLCHALDQQFYPKRFIELYDFHHTHRFLDWINTFTF
ncbi:unnamed protein product [Blepharisma stoltei]|uniref:NAD(P)-binding domain-containing protein n=1 Tax=Blepharisma stoltei TaxID=1481888 RepID=A0AAU9JW21_9CILI|nr:unnamed protein product [Blepharisma stoltei]